MDIYEIIIHSLTDNQYLILKNKQVDIVYHLNEGATPLRGGIGTPIQCMFGGKSYCSVHCLEIADEVKNKFGSKKVNVNLENLDKKSPKFQIENVLMQYEGNNILIEIENDKMIKF